VQDKQPPSSFIFSVRDSACSETKQGLAVRPKPAFTENLMDEPVTKRVNAERRFMLQDQTPCSASITCPRRPLPPMAGM